MTRPEEDVRGRLQRTALALFRERGYEQITAAEIAARAGVTERTFFRHFPDKREVLFDGEAALRAILVDAVATAPPGLAPLPLVVRAFTAAVPLLIQNRPVAEQRAQVIAVTPALQERAYAKTAALTDALASALADRDISPPTARLAAQVGMAAFDRASRRWGGDPAVDLSASIAQAVDEVLTLGET